MALKEYEKKQHQFDSSSGDFMTIYNIYQAFRSFMRIPKTLTPEGINQNANVPMNGGANNNNNNGKNNGTTNNVPSVIPIEQLTKKTAQDARRWCIENGISPRVFVDSRNKLSWDKVGNEVRKIENTLMKAVQPPELRRTYFAKYKEDGGVANQRQLAKEIEESKKELQKITPPEDRINGEETPEPSIQNKSESEVLAMEGGSSFQKNIGKEELIQQYIQFGGYNAKPYEINYFPNATLYEKKEDNIMASLAHGFFTRMVKHVNKNFYSTCFPLQPVMCNPDMNSTVSLSAKPKYLIYSELFMLRENQPILKLNIVNKLPTKIQSEIKEQYGKLIENCYKTIKINKMNKRNHQRREKGDRGQKRKKRFTKKRYPRR